jgi:hypothetical protein
VIARARITVIAIIGTRAFAMAFVVTAFALNALDHDALRVTRPLALVIGGALWFFGIERARC